MISFLDSEAVSELLKFRTSSPAMGVAGISRMFEDGTLHGK
jgi:hypothetical protein